ncbi:Serendipity locus protein H-1 [Pseudolycoriella hygida]|uniref:Serendipity locus protein H-1 n=1 Tax=Pseudolycoriella hygida TaxID=35572 RepID=A0A9Q0MW98_9DIPT|nr:Serendipity locus protein H-1 [Pseudolycoriella hygida]
MKSADEIEIIDSYISANDLFFKDESLDIHFRNCQPISTCMIFDYDTNDYTSGQMDSITGDSVGKKNKRKATAPKRTTEDKVIGIDAGTFEPRSEELEALSPKEEANKTDDSNVNRVPPTKSQKSAAKSNYEYLCHNCNVSFTSRSDFEAHYRNSYQKTPLYTCTKCKKQLQNIRSFRGHIYRHVATLYQHQCPTCSRKFGSSELLEQHQRTHLVVEQKCIDCGMEFPSFDELKQHRREHRTADKMKNKDLKWKCIDCGKMLMNRSSLFMHEKIHKDRQYSCELCPQKFVQKNNLLNHVKTHTQDKKFPCTIPQCGKTFVGKSQLLRHHTFHVNIRNFPCDTCGKRYKSERDLKVHSLIHSVQRPHACNHCSKTFLSSSKLKQHFNIHTGARPYKCKYCPRDFTNFPNWLKHIRRRHKVDHKTGEQLEEMPNFLIKDRKENKDGQGNDSNRQLENNKHKKSKKKQMSKKPKVEQDKSIEVLSLDDTLPLNTSDDLERAATLLMQQTLEMEENDPHFSGLPQDVSDIPEQNLFHVNDYMTDQIIFSTAITEPNISSSFGPFIYSFAPTTNDDQTKITLPPITTMKNRRNLMNHSTQQLFSTNVL